MAPLAASAEEQNQLFVPARLSGAFGGIVSALVHQVQELQEQVETLQQQQAQASRDLHEVAARLQEQKAIVDSKAFEDSKPCESFRSIDESPESCRQLKSDEALERKAIDVPIVFDENAAHNHIQQMWQTFVDTELQKLAWELKASRECAEARAREHESRVVQQSFELRSVKAAMEKRVTLETMSDRLRVESKRMEAFARNEAKVMLNSFRTEERAHVANLEEVVQRIDSDCTNVAGWIASRIGEQEISKASQSVSEGTAHGAEVHKLVDSSERTNLSCSDDVPEQQQIPARGSSLRMRLRQHVAHSHPNTDAVAFVHKVNSDREDATDILSNDLSGEPVIPAAASTITSCAPESKQCDTTCLDKMVRSWQGKVWPSLATDERTTIFRFKPLPGGPEADHGGASGSSDAHIMSAAAEHSGAQIQPRAPRAPATARPASASYRRRDDRDASGSTANPHIGIHGSTAAANCSGRAASKSTAKPWLLVNARGAAFHAAGENASRS